MSRCCGIQGVPDTTTQHSRPRPLNNATLEDAAAQHRHTRADPGHRMSRCCGVQSPNVTLLRNPGGPRHNSATLATQATQLRHTRAGPRTECRVVADTNRRMSRCCGFQGVPDTTTQHSRLRPLNNTLEDAAAQHRHTRAGPRIECRVVAGSHRRMSRCCGIQGVPDTTAQHSRPGPLNNVTLDDAAARVRRSCGAGTAHTACCRSTGSQRNSTTSEARTLNAPHRKPPPSISNEPAPAAGAREPSPIRRPTPKPTRINPIDGTPSATAPVCRVPTADR